MNTSRLLAAGLLIAAAPALAESIASLSDTDQRALRAALIASRHGFLSQPDGTHLARNPGQAWHLCFDARGFTVTPDVGGWQWGLELQQGAEGREPEADALRPAPSALRNRLSIHHNPNLEEWFVNDERGLEQGWTLWKEDDASALPAGRTRLHLRVRGGLSPEVSAQAVRFLDASGGEVLTYDGLKAWDATGRVLPAWFETAPHGFAVVTDTRDAVYPVTIDPVAQQSAYLKASNTEADDFFGDAMAISGDTIVIGAQSENSAATGVNGNQTDNSAPKAGAAYVFRRQGKIWKQEAYLKASNTRMDHHFGVSVAISGDTIVIGATGDRSNATGINGNQTDTSAPGAGAAYVFRRQGKTWKQEAYVKASNTDAVDFFGRSVAVSGDTIVVGAYNEASAAMGVNGDQADNSASATGAAYVFGRQPDGQWSQIAYLKASNAVAQGIFPLHFGLAVAVSGNVIVVGAPDENGVAVQAGAAYVYRRFGNSVSPQVAYLKASNPDASDRFGSSVAVSGDHIVVGATGERSNATGVNGDQTNNSASNAGAAYVFKFGLSGGMTAWHPTAYLKASNTAAGNLFGLNVAISGDTIAVSAPGETSLSTGVNGSQTQGGAFGVGAAYVFTRLSGLGWVQHAYLKASNSTGLLVFGGSNGLAISGDTVVVGAIGEASNATGVNGDQVNEDAPNSGAAYVFDLARTLASLAVSGQSAPGAADLFYTRAGQPALSSTRAAFTSRLNGGGAAGGANHAVFSNLGPVNQVDMVLRRRDLIGSLLDLPPNTRVTALGEPVNNRIGSEPHVLFLASVSGSGLNNAGSRVLFKDDGAFLTPLLRTGRPLPPLVFNGAKLSKLHEVTQLFNGNMMLPCQLSRGSGVDKTNDSGVLVLNAAGAVDVIWREGGLAPGGGVFGQFRPEASIWVGNSSFIAPFITAGEKPRDAFYALNMRFPSVQGDAAPGLGGTARLGKFLAASMADDVDVNNFRLRTTLTGGPRSENEAIWHGFNGGQALLRKGEDLGGARIRRFLRFWPVQNPQGQTAALVRLSGPGVNGKNSVALILRQSNTARMILLRAGDPAPGYDDPRVTIGRLLRVEVNSLGSYAVLATLRGVPASRNLALFAGGIFMGSDNVPAERLPRRVFSKGGHYTSDVTEMNRIRGILLEPAVERTGAGGRGLRQIVHGSGRIACTVIGDRGRRELALALAP